MNLKQLEAFVKIANNRSFSRTADELFLTQPTVSASITNLEKELGVRLFIRTAKGACLTGDGRKMYLYARQIIESTQAIAEMFSAETEGARFHQVIIAASTIPTQYILPGILAEFSKRYPTAEFQVREMSSLGVVKEIENHTSDIGFTGTLVESDKCEYHSFYHDELVIVTPNTPKYRKLKENKVPVEEWIKNEPVIMRGDQSGTRLEALKKLEELGIASEELKIVATIDNPGAILHSVKKDIGITFISSLAAEDDIKNGTLLSFPITKDGCKRPLYVLYNSKLPVSDCTKKIMKVVKDIYKGL